MVGLHPTSNLSGRFLRLFASPSWSIGRWHATSVGPGDVFEAMAPEDLAISPWNIGSWWNIGMIYLIAMAWMMVYPLVN